MNKQKIIAILLMVAGLTCVNSGFAVAQVGTNIDKQNAIPGHSAAKIRPCDGRYCPGKPTL
jgi:hypothetical protein